MWQIILATLGWLGVVLVVAVVIIGGWVLYKIFRDDEVDGYSFENFAKPKEKSGIPIIEPDQDTELLAAAERMRQSSEFNM
jgi:hypothetical protein